MTRRRWCWPLLMLLAGCLGGVNAAVMASAQEAPRYEPAARGTRPSVTRWRGIVAQYDDWNVERALRLIDCESGGDPDAENPTSGTLGLMQLEPSWRRVAIRLFDSRYLVNPWTNIATGHYIWLAGGGRFGSRIGWQASQFCWDTD